MYNVICAHCETSLNGELAEYFKNELLCVPCYSDEMYELSEKYE